MEKKKISRKLVMTYICIAVVVVLQIVASITHTDCQTAMIIVATACGIYNISNVASKFTGGNNGN